MKIDYSCERFKFWIELHSITFERKLANETAFDLIVKMYSLKTGDQNLNSLLEGKIFGNFFFPSSHGVFLRLFQNKESWPKTTLIHIDFKRLELKEIQKTKSSWDVWTGFYLGDEKYSIEISPEEKIEVQL